MDVKSDDLFDGMFSRSPQAQLGYKRGGVVAESYAQAAMTTAAVGSEVGGGLCRTAR